MKKKIVFDFGKYITYCLCNIQNTILFIILFTESRPYQYLPYRAGYIPVYIRIGDTPLSEIHPDLVEAFHENEIPRVSSDITYLTKVSESEEVCIKLYIIQQTCLVKNFKRIE